MTGQAMKISALYNKEEISRKHERFNQLQTEEQNWQKLEQSPYRDR